MAAIVPFITSYYPFHAWHCLTASQSKLRLGIAHAIRDDVWVADRGEEIVKLIFSGEHAPHLW
jgi:hypothetical protein